MHVIYMNYIRRLRKLLGSNFFSQNIFVNLWINNAEFCLKQTILKICNVTVYELIKDYGNQRNWNQQKKEEETINVNIGQKAISFTPNH